MLDISNGWEFYDRIWRPGQLVVSDIERQGIVIDPDACERQRGELLPKITEVTNNLNEWAEQELNWGSWQQLQVFLYCNGSKKPSKKGALIKGRGWEVPPICGSGEAVKIVQGGEMPTDSIAVQWLADNEEDEEQRAGLELILEHKLLTKIAGFYATLLKLLGSDGRLHTQLSPKTETGRLASSKPNLQNIPIRSQLGRLIRSVFRAPPGRKLVVLDFSGLEWRILAHVLLLLYGDSSLVDDIKKGIDPHSATLARLCEAGYGFPECKGIPVERLKKEFPDQRDVCKKLNYGINYGKTEIGIGASVRDSVTKRPIGRERGRRLLDGFYASNPGIARFHQDIIASATKTGRVRSLLGRPRYIPELRSSRRGLRNSGARKAQNIIQNCATDVMAVAMLAVNTNPELKHTGWYSQELVDLEAQTDLQVHDELVFECPEENAEPVKGVAAELMSGAIFRVREFLCPLECSGGIGDNWLEAGGK